MRSDPPWHAHVYYAPAQRAAAAALRERFERLTAPGSDPPVLFVGPMRDGPVGPHPLAQYEVHIPASARAAVMAMIEAAGLRALVHPLTQDDLADHTTHGLWIGEPLALDLTALDPPGVNQGMARFGKTDV